jgi:hypothetical protein
MEYIYITFTDYTVLFLNILFKYNTLFTYMSHVKWVPVTTAWRVLGLRMEERPPGMEGSWEYIE